MKFTIDKTLVIEQLKRQLCSLFLMSDEQMAILDRYYDTVLKRCEYCFSRNPSKYYFDKGETVFNPYISTQYVIFLHYFANTIYKDGVGNNELCDKIYYLNKSLNSLDIFYAVDLPDFFMCEHPVGSVMGRAEYSRGFMFYQNCSVGGFHLADNKIAYPKIGENVRMFAGSTIIGQSTIGDNVNIGAGALIKNQDVPPNSNVFGQSPNIIIKERPLV